MSQTRWVFPPPWANRSAAPPPPPARDGATCASCDVAALAALARASLARGHVRVATRRCLMLQAAGAVVPADLAHLLALRADPRAERERQRMQAQAWQWARMLRPAAEGRPDHLTHDLTHDLLHELRHDAGLN